MNVYRWYDSTMPGNLQHVSTFLLAWKMVLFPHLKQKNAVTPKKGHFLTHDNRMSPPALFCFINHAVSSFVNYEDLSNITSRDRFTHSSVWLPDSCLSLQQWWDGYLFPRGRWTHCLLPLPITKMLQLSRKAVATGIFLIIHIRRARASLCWWSHQLFPS